MPDKGELLPHHLAMLKASGLSHAIIEQRGYQSVTKRAELHHLGFGDQQCSVPALLLPIRTVTGALGGYQSRPDQPRMRKGKVVKYETLSDMRMILDIHPCVRHLLKNPAIPLFITEGVKKGDALACRGCCAVALLGVWNWRGTNEEGGRLALPDWESIALNGRQIYIVFDSDVAVKPEVHAALSRLKAFLESRGAQVTVIYLPNGPHGAKVGVDDYLASGHTVSDLIALASPDLRPAPANGENDEGPGPQADALVAIGRKAELFHDTLGDPLAAIELDGHREIWPLRTRRFGQWLRFQYFRTFHKAPGSDAVRTAIGVLEGLAVFEGVEHALSNRVAWHEGALYYDLTDNAWRAVRVDADGWSVADRPPILFRRFAHQRPQVLPAPEGNPWDLFRFLNVLEADRLLLLVWLIAAFLPGIPHPIADFHGEKGAGKSLGQRVQRRLINPSEVELLSFPSEVRELVQQLSHHYAPCYDNIDGLPPWLSDLLCRAVTGDGFSKRELYSDDDDVIYHYQRVILLNGINVVSQRSDLLDRTILIGLVRLSKTERREERVLWEAFEAARPHLLGALFTTLSRALRVYPTLQLPELERMADFTRWGAAISEALGRDAEDFLDAYNKNVHAQTREAAEGHVVGAAILALMEDRITWVGTPSELLAALEEVGAAAKLFRRTSSGKVETRGWPGAPHILTRRLNEVQSNLIDLGIAIAVDRDGERRTITIKGMPTAPEDSVISVTSVTQARNYRHDDDAVRDAIEVDADATAGRAAALQAQPDANDATLATQEEWEEVIR